MTQDEVIKMAINTANHGTHANGEVIYTFYSEQLEAFANLVAAKEREACAEVADEYANQVFEHNFSKLIAHNIRARGQV